MPPIHQFQHLPLLMRYQGAALIRGGGKQAADTKLHFPRKPIGEQWPADEISPPHLRGRKLPQPGSVR